MANLVDFQLYHNQFTGNLPTALAKFPEFFKFEAHGNGFSGTIPSEYRQLEKLEMMKSYRNNLTGSVHKEVCNAKTDHDLHLFYSIVGAQSWPSFASKYHLLANVWWRWLAVVSTSVASLTANLAGQTLLFLDWMCSHVVVASWRKGWDALAGLLLLKRCPQNINCCGNSQSCRNYTFLTHCWYDSNGSNDNIVQRVAATNNQQPTTVMNSPVSPDLNSYTPVCARCSEIVI